jgi:hypothetical protein
MHSLYNRGEDVAITRVPGDAYLVIDSADRSSSTSSTGEPLAAPYTQPYNNFRLQKPQNLVQGGFTRLQLTEVNFPYAIPNINPYTDTMWIRIINPTGGATIDQKVQLNNGSPNFATGTPLVGMYYGNFLAAALGTQLNNLAAISSSIGITWGVIYVPSDIAASYNGGFQIICTLTSTGAEYPFALYPSNPTSIGVQPIPAKSLLNVLGFNPLSNWTYLTTPSSVKFSAYAPLSYTSYIDIVSSKLTYYQNVQDSSSKTNSKGGVICRLFVTNDNSANPTVGYFYNGTTAVRYQSTLPAGSAPFIIHRQFVCPKSFKWNKNTAIDTVDIQLYDDVGQPLYISSDGTYPDFQITFKCTED